MPSVALRATDPHPKKTPPKQPYLTNRVVMRKHATTLLTFMENTMASKRKSKSNAAFSGWTLINRSLAHDELEAFDSWYSESYDDLEELIAVYGNEGYKFGISRAVDADMVIVSMTGKDEDCVNYKRTITAWSHTLVEGLLMCVFKHQVVFESGLWENDSSSRRG